MNTNMKAIILAAGESSRLYPLTLTKPKCLIEVGGKRIIDHQIEMLRKVGIEDIVVVVGYKKDMIVNALGSTVRYCEYNDFATTNNFATLWHIRDELKNNFVCLFSDVLFEIDILVFR